MPKNFAIFTSLDEAQSETGYFSASVVKAANMALRSVDSNMSALALGFHNPIGFDYLLLKQFKARHMVFINK